MKFFILVRRLFKAKNDLSEENLFLKSIWVGQAKQLLKLFNADLTAMVNGIIRINKDYKIDFSFIDKVIAHITEINKEELHTILRQIKGGQDSFKKKSSSNRSQNQSHLNSDTLISKTMEANPDMSIILEQSEIKPRMRPPSMGLAQSSIIAK